MKRRLASVSRSAELHSRLLRLITLHPAFFFALGLAVAFAVLRPAALPVPAFDPTRPVEIRGWICSPPLVLSDRVEFEFQPALVTQQQQPVTVWGRILVRIYSSTWPPKQYFGSPLSFGESLEMTGLLVEPAYNAVPGVIDSRIFAVHKKTYYRMRIKSPLQLIRLGYSAHPLALIQVPLFKYIQAFEEASSSRLTLTAFQLIAGAFLGRRQFLEHQMTLRIQELGIQHLFVVSGLHVGLVLAFAGFSLRRFGVPGQLAALSIMWIYIVAVGLLVPSVRAGVLATVAFLLIQSGIRVRPLNALGISAMVILLLAPDSIDSPSFQFSFAAMVTICLVGIPSMRFVQAFSAGLSDAWSETTILKSDPSSGVRRWSRYWVEEHCEFLPRFQSRAVLRRISSLLPYVAGLLVISGSIQIVITPLVLYYSNQLNPLQILGNVLLIPLFSLLVPIILGFFLSFWLPIGQLLVLPIEFLTGLIDQLVSWITSLSDAVYLPHPTTWEALAYFSLLIGTFLFLRYDWRFLLPILIVPSFAWMTSADPAPSNELEITFLDVGQGDCIHIAYPDGSHGLIDTGPRVYTGDPDFVARRVVSRYLWQRRIQKLAHVVISHPEDDHRGGYEFLSRAFPIDRLYFYRSQPDYAEPAIQLRSNSSFIHGRVSHQVLHPPAESSIWRDNNDSSVVLLLTFGHFSALLGGDVSKRVEEGLPALENTVTLLKVGHHGSRTSTSERFLQRLGPKLAVISAGRRNRFGHPANEVMERLKRFTRAVYSTQTSGTIRVRTDGHQVRVEGYRQAGGFETVEEFSVRTP